MKIQFNCLGEIQVLDIKILNLFDGAKEAKGLTVIIDVFRAFSVACYVFNNNASRLITTGSIEYAYELKKKMPESILMGEREGKIQPGFDFGNSPTSIEKVDFTGKTIIQTTSAGTKGISLAQNADEIITGSMVNAGAISSYIKSKNQSNISLVCMGNDGLSTAAEDVVCAEYIRSLIENRPYDLSGNLNVLKDTAGERFFDKEKYWCPESDFYLCTKVSIFDFVLKATRFDKYSHIISRIDPRGDS